MRLVACNQKVIDQVRYAFGVELKLGQSIIHEDLPDYLKKFWIKNYRRALKGESLEVETPHKKSSQPTFSFFETTLTPIKNGNSVVGVACASRDATDKKKAEAQMKALQNELIEAQRVAKIGSWHFDLKTKNLSWTEALYHIFGLDSNRDVITPEIMYGFIHPDDFEAFKKLQKKAMGGKSKDFRHRIVLKNGEVKWVHQLGESHRDKSGEVVSLSGTMQDVTSLMKLIDELKYSNERFGAIAQTTREAIYEWDIIKDKLHWEPVFYELYGSKRKKNGEENLKDWKKRLHPDDAAVVDRNLQQTLKAPRKHYWKYIYRIRRKGGGYATVEEHGHIFRDTKGNTIRMVGRLRDVTAETESRQLLEDSEKLSRNLFELNPHPMWVYDLETLRFLDVNHAAIQKYGYSRKQFLSMTIRDIRPVEEIKGLMLAVNRLRNNDTTATGGWHRHRTKKGEILDVEIRSNLFEYKGRRADLVVAVDMTDEIRKTRLIEIINQRLINAERIGSIGYFERDLQKDKVFWSDGLYALLGIKPQGQSPDLSLFLRYVHPDDRELFESEYWKARNDQVEMFIEHRIINARKQVKILLNTGRVVLDKKGKPLRFEGIVQDITRRREAEIQIKQINEKLTTAQKIAGLGYWVFDLNTQTAELSDTVYEIWELDRNGRKPDFLTFLRSIHPEDRLLFTPPVELQYSNGDYREVEHRIITPKSGEKWIFERIHLRRGPKGKPQFLEAVVQDVTLGRQKDQALRISNQRFEMAMQVTNEVIWDWDIVRNAVVRSRGYQTNFGIHVWDKPSGVEDWLGYIAEDQRDTVSLSLQKAIQNSEVSEWNAEYKFMKPDGGLAYINDRGLILRDRFGKAVRMVGSMRDVTDERVHLQKIEAQNTALRKIAWIQSHEVRAPLANIVGLVELLQNFEQDPKETESLLRLLHEAAGQLDIIIHEISYRAEHIGDENRIENGRPNSDLGV